MTTEIIYLTPSEQKALHLMADWSSTRHIYNSCEIPVSGMGVFTSEIRRKTGIRNHKDGAECKAYLEKYKAAMSGPGLSETQLRVLRLLLDDNTYTGVAYRLSITSAEAVEIVESACAAAGIFSRDERARRVQIRIYLASRHPIGAPLSNTEEKVLRLMAEGHTPSQIARDMGEREQYISWKAKGACLRLGFNARGRGVQRQLLRGYFARLDAEKPAPIDMTDPAFN